MSFEQYLIKFNYRERIEDLLWHGYSSERAYQEKIDEILED